MYEIAWLSSKWIEVWREKVVLRQIRRGWTGSETSYTNWPATAAIAAPGPRGQVTRDGVGARVGVTAGVVVNAALGCKDDSWFGAPDPPHAVIITTSTTTVNRTKH